MLDPVLDVNKMGDTFCWRFQGSCSGVPGALLWLSKMHLLPEGNKIKKKVNSKQWQLFILFESYKAT